MSLWRWSDWIATVPPESRISIGENETPLVHASRLGEKCGLENLFFKVESGLPTGSYKDRFAAVAISLLKAHGKRRCVTCSSGNAGAAIAAYCAAAGISCRVVVIDGVPAGKLQQIQCYGAELVSVEGFGFDSRVTSRVLRRLGHWGERPDVDFLVSAFAYCADAMSGVQTISYELATQLPTIDHVFVPAGGGGLTLACARGFQVVSNREGLVRRPTIECVQPDGNATIAAPLRDGRDRAVAVECTTKVSGLQVANVIDGDAALQACRACGGTGHLVSDPEVYEAQRQLAEVAGILTEPAGAVAFAGALKAKATGRLDPKSVVVCLVTGSGFKDRASLDRMEQSHPLRRVDIEELERMDF